MTRPTDDMQEMIAFLCGETELHGVSFNEIAPGERGKWWWRPELRRRWAAMLRACKGGAVKALKWDDFEGNGAKANAFYQASYLITRWRGRNEFEVALSFPGYQTGYDGERFHKTLEAAKAAAQADYEHRILSALEPAPDARQEGWRAGIEAAAAECDMLADIELSAAHESYAQGYSDGADNCAAAIRALAEKGPDHE